MSIFTMAAFAVVGIAGGVCYCDIVYSIIMGGAHGDDAQKSPDY
jgi:hypothetical protein